MERDTDLLKLQILADYYHSKYSSYVSFIFGFVIAWIVAFVTFLIQKAIDYQTYIVSVFAGYGIMAFFLFILQRFYNSNLDRVDELIQSMNKNRFEPLPSIRELRKRKPRGEPK